MAKYFQSLHIVGVAGSDAKITQTSGGNSVVKVSVVVSEFKPKGDGTFTEYATWYNVTAWMDSSPKIYEQLVTVKKGCGIAATGRPSVEAYIKRDGTAGGSLTLSPHTVLVGYMPRNNDEDSSESESGSGQPNSYAEPQQGGDIPF